MLHWGVYFIIASTIFRSLGVVHIIGEITLNQAVIVSLFFIVITTRLFEREQPYRIDGTDIALCVFGIYLWVSNFLISSDPGWGVRVCTDYIRTLTCYFLVIMLITDRRKIHIFVWTYILSSLIMVLTANLFSTVQTGLDFSYEGRSGLTGMAGQYIEYALYALISIPFAYYTLKNSRSMILRIFLVCTIGVLSIAALFSGSRGGIVSFVIMMSFMSILELMHSKRFRTLHGALAMTLGICAFMFFWVKGGNTMVESILPAITGEGKMDPSLHGRITFAKQFTEIFFQNMIFGLGIDSSRHILTGHVPHNQWLQIMSELGLIGLSLALAAVVFIFRGALQARKRLVKTQDTELMNHIHALIVVVFTVLCWGFYENIGFIAAEKVIFMLFALGVSLKKISATPSENKNEHPSTNPTMRKTI